MKKGILILIMFLIMINSSLAATIHGTIYDINLNKVKDAIVEVNSSPNQRMVSIDGTYSFDLPIGNYKIYAFYGEKNNFQKTKENISINSEGNFVLDLFLFYDITSEENLLNSTDINFYSPFKNNYNYYFAAIIIILLIILFLIFRLFFKKKKEIIAVPKEELLANDNDLHKIISILKKYGGRATQKDIRHEIPLSEAKISLMIAELESEGKIKKIKKGRGNIIVLE